ncbi:MAG: PP2C family serine/threonine-protein phosphatase [Cyanobacteriota bacterium]|nr:PP2C family serine/threonine-protein phosphatase [Cyanobacteriota bacterium]
MFQRSPFASSWKAVARSVVGAGHLSQNLPCQDACLYRRQPSGLLLGAVADGAGSAAYSQLGAELAVRESLDYLARWETFLQRRRRRFLPWLKDLTPDQRRKFFAKLLRFLRRSLACLAAQEGVEYKSLASTLLVFIAGPEGVAAMQIGDGFMVVRAQTGDYELLFHPDKGEYINETTFITSANALEDIQSSVYERSPHFICAATDGLEKVAIKYQDWSAFGPFFQPLETFLTEIKDPEAEDEYLQNFLQSERLNQRTQDDKTLLIALALPPAPPPRPPQQRRVVPKSPPRRPSRPIQRIAPDRSETGEDSLTGKPSRDILAGGLPEGPLPPWLED